MQSDSCPYAKGHFDRINDAIFELMTTKEHYSREEIEACAQKYKVCPFELGLDMSLFSDGILCDYNYVFLIRMSICGAFSEKVQAESSICF